MTPRCIVPPRPTRSSAGARECSPTCERKGVLSLDVFPEQMTAPLVNRYLEIKPGICCDLSVLRHRVPRNLVDGNSCAAIHRTGAEDA